MPRSFKSSIELKTSSVKIGSSALVDSSKNIISGFKASALAIDAITTSIEPFLVRWLNYQTPLALFQPHGLNTYQML